jgi:hypothetical protein
VIVDGKAQRRALTIDRLQNGMAMVTRGIVPGDQVVVDGIAGLNEGRTVKILVASPPEVPAAPTASQSQ